jgi:hypothetical protein
VAAQIGVLPAELVAVAAEVADLEGCLACGTARQWLGLPWGLSPAEAGRTMRLAGRLGPLPALRAAFASGELSEGTVESLCRVATPENEARLIETARVATGAQLQTLVRDRQRVTDAAGDDDDPVAEPADGFGWYIDERGRYRWGGSSAADQGAAIVAAIDAAGGAIRTRRHPPPLAHPRLSTAPDDRAPTYRPASRLRGQMRKKARPTTDDSGMVPK